MNIINLFSQKLQYQHVTMTLTMTMKSKNGHLIKYPCRTGTPAFIAEVKCSVDGKLNKVQLKLKYVFRGKKYMF